ncbi:MAG: pyruvate kinase [Gammaproteobacteria bacterium]|nr:pyruvate kinase [Gammaproteobacteria bacterium]
MRRTKIVATLGPASSDYEILRKMIASGLNVARLNFSHGTADDHAERVKTIRRAAKDEGKIVGILADLQGPKIRIARFKNGKVNLKNGSEFTLDASLDVNEGDEKQVGIDYKELPNDVKPNDVLLLDDGRLVFNVERIEGTKVICRVTAGGELSNNKGINRQGGGLTAPALTEKDKKDLKTAIKLKVDYLAISFVRSAEDVAYAKQLVKAEKGNAGIIAKIERVEAVEPDTLDAIIAETDGIMVARGDLGVEIGDAQVPAAQKRMITRARDLNKPVITATQMMETMIHNVVPTRAEVSDVANAVLDSTDAVMLSAESATGDHPDLVINTMARIAIAAEEDPITKTSQHRMEVSFGRIDETISMATMYAANHLQNVTAIICLTESGSTPLWMSRIHTGIPIFALSRHENTLGRMALYRDVHPIFFDVTKHDSAKIKNSAISLLKKQGLIKDGDLVIITRGPKRGVHGGTNSMTIVEVGQ